MSKKSTLLFLSFLSLCFLVGAVIFLNRNSILVLEPKGIVAFKERDLLLKASALMALIVVPVLCLTFGIAWKYRASNTEAKYSPDWDHNLALESLWWALPCIIIGILSVMSWEGSHQLDPFQPLNSSVKPLTVQVIALRWKWLFIYPDQGIATVNFLQFPERTPINFLITSDAPMNSFWIPQLGGQVYAMAGMTTQLHLMADAAGTFAGASANLSGAGFSGMKFVAKSSSTVDFDQWVDSARQVPNSLDSAEYTQLALPSTDTLPGYYSNVMPNLFHSVLMRYVHLPLSSPGDTTSSSQ